jgi:hypothetical protein
MTEHAMAQLRIVHYLNGFSVAKFVSVYVRLALGTAFFPQWLIDSGCGDRRAPAM